MVFSIAAIALAVTTVMLLAPSPLGPAVVNAQVGGTTPTRLTTFTPTVLTGNRLQVRCRITRLNGAPVSGLYPVRLYLLYPTYSQLAGSANTDANGYATLTISRPQSGTVLGWDFAGNGAYSRPLRHVTAP